MASDLKKRIQGDLISARKERDKARTLVVSTLLSDIRNKEIEIGNELDDDGVVQVISKSIKQRQDASTQMREAGRAELADTEDSQAAILADYMPAGLSEAEVRGMVREAIAAGVSEIGPLMGRLMPLIRGRFDGKEANRLVREELAP